MNTISFGVREHRRWDVDRVYRVKHATGSMLCMDSFAKLMNVTLDTLPDRAIVTASTGFLPDAATTWVKWWRSEDDLLGWEGLYQGDWIDWAGSVAELYPRAARALRAMGIPKDTWTKIWITYKEDG